MRILENGASGVALVGCSNDDCKFLTGTDVAEKRIRRAQKLLKEINYDPVALAMERGKDLTQEDLLKIALKRAQAISVSNNRK